MAEQAGFTAKVYIKTGSAITNNTGAKINGVDDETYTKLCNILEITQLGDTHVKRMAGLQDTNLSLSGNYDPADTNGQLLLVPGNTVYAGVYHLGTGSAGLGQVAFIVENFEQKATPDGKQEFSCSLLGNGAPVALPAQL